MLLERRDLQYRCRMVLPCPIATPRVYYCPPGLLNLFPLPHPPLLAGLNAIFSTASRSTKHSANQTVVVVFFVYFSQVDAPFRTTSAPPSEQAQFHYQQLAWRNQTQMQMNNSNNVPGAGGGQPGPVPGVAGPGMAPKAAGGGGGPQQGQQPQGGQQVHYNTQFCFIFVFSLPRVHRLVLGSSISRFFGAGYFLCKGADFACWGCSVFYPFLPPPVDPRGGIFAFDMFGLFFYLPH